MTRKRQRSQDTRNLAGIRDRFIASTATGSIGTPFGPVPVSNLPLFKEIDGALHQAVRFRLPASDDPTALTLRLTQGENVIAEVSASLGDDDQSVLLFAPEVDESTTVTAEIRANGETIGSGAHELTPQRKFTVHLVHHSHYDIGYTDPQSIVMEAQLSFIDYALELATLTDDWSDDAKFRWNIEVTWPLKHWLRTRPKHARDALLRRIKEGRFEVHALPFSMHSEAYSMDELAQQLVFARELREEWGIDIVTAMQTDVPGSTIGLATLLTDADVKYLAVAHNYAGISVPYLRDGQLLKRPFYWQAPDGEKLLVWYTDTLFGNAYMEAMQIGFGSGYADVLGSLPEYLNALVQKGYPYGEGGDWMNLSLRDVEITKVPYEYDVLHMRVQGAYADNASSSILPAQIVKEWNETWAFPKLRSSIDRDFFADIESRIGDSLETYAGDWSDWWAIGVGSAAFALGRNRQSQADIRTAQTLHALADVVTDEPLPTIAEDVRAAYENMALFDEHTWGAANPWGREVDKMSSGAYQWTRKEAFAYTAEEQTQTLLNSGLQRIAPLAASTSNRQSEATQSLLVFNPHSWPRTDLARVFIPRHNLVGEDTELALIDVESGEHIPALFEAQDNASHRPIGRWLRFVARSVPPLGYRRYALVPAQGQESARSETSGTPGQFANARLAVELDVSTGSIASIRDLAGDRELVAADAPFGFNRYIYDRYTSAPGFNHLSSRIGGAAGPWLLGSRKTGEYGLITGWESNGVWERMTLRYAGDGSDWAETTLTLPHGTSRLHIRNRLHKPVTMQKESLYFAFPFAGEDAAINCEITGGVVGPDSPHVPGSLDHYRTLAHWATITQDDQAPIAWATNEAPLVQFGNIHLPYAPFPATIPEWEAHPTTIYSWALNNIWDTNFPPEQGGELTFSYVVGVGGDDAIALGRDTGAAASSPLVGVCAPVGVTALPDTPDSGSFIRLDHPAVEISHLAPARDGSGIAVFLHSLADEPVTAAMEVIYPRIARASEGTFLETGLTDLAIDNGRLNVAIAPGELKTVVLRLAN
ncbi:MAG: hypothetical protein WBA63_11170 [Thermomicrobiales bacterium]